MNGADVLIATVATFVATILTALISAWQARKADKSAKVTHVIETGVATLVDQLQEEREVLKDEVDEFRTKYREIERQFRQAKAELRQAREDLLEAMHVIELREAEIIRLKRISGEPFNG